MVALNEEGPLILHYTSNKKEALNMITIESLMWINAQKDVSNLTCCA